MGVKYVTVSGGNTYADYAFSSSGTTQNVEFYYYHSAAPTAEVALGYIYAGATQVVGFFMNTSGTTRIRDFGNASTITGSNSIGAYTLVAATQYRIAIQIISGTTTSNGSCYIAIYIGDSATAVATFTAAGTYNAGASQSMSLFRLGRSGGAATATTYYFDDPQLANGLTAGTFIGPPSAPTLPVANAGPDQTVASGATVTLAGSGTNTPTSRAWTQTAGTTVTLSSTTIDGPTFTAPSVGSTTTLTFSYTATNAAGTSTPDTVNITVNPAAPVANAGPDQFATSATTVTLSGSGTNSPTSYAWTQTSGTTVTLSSTTVASPTFTAPTTGTTITLVFSFTATNATGTSAADTVTITVNPPAPPSYLNTAEGQTSGATISAANSSASGQPFTTVLINTGNTATYDTTHPAHGTKGFKLVTAASSNTYLPMDLPSASTSANIEFYYYYVAAPTGSELPIGYILSSGSTKSNFAINTAGTVRIRDAAAANPLTGQNAIGGYTLVANTQYRFALQLIEGTTSTNGSCYAAIYIGDSATAVATFTAAGTYNSGTTDYTNVFFGRSGAWAAASTQYYDDAQAGSGLAAGSFLGVPSATIPVANAGADQAVSGNAVVTMSGSGTNTPTSYTWRQISGTAVTLSSTTTASVSFSAPNSSVTLVFGLIATNGNGASAEDTISIVVTPAATGGGRGSAAEIVNGAESGTNGTTVTTSNSGDANDDAWSSVFVGTGGGITYTNVQEMHGNLSYQMVQASGQANYLKKIVTSTPRITLRYYFRITAYPAAENPLMSIWSGGNNQTYLAMNTTGTIRVRDANQASTVTGSNAMTTPVSLNVWHRVEVYLDISGNFGFRMYTGDSTSATDIFEVAGWVGGPDNFDAIYVGRTSGNALTTTILMDDFAADTTMTSGYIGPFSTTYNPVPGVTAGATQSVEPLSTFTLTTSATGSPDYYTWTQTYGTTVTLSDPTIGNPTFTVPATGSGSTLVFSVTATNSSGVSAPATQTVIAYPQVEWVLQSNVWTPEVNNFI
jgi:hypothetical protein